MILLKEPNSVKKVTQNFDFQCCLRPMKKFLRTTVKRLMPDVIMLVPKCLQKVMPGIYLVMNTNF